MTAANFDRALALVLVSEGGYVNNINDKGGPTNLGITQSTLSSWRGKPVTPDDVRALTRAEAADIYRRNYWSVVHGDDLPSGLDYAVFDFAVNSGPKRAIEYLQKSIGVTVDGVMGPKTIAAVNSVDPSTAKADIVELCNERLIYLKSLPTWPEFGNGWSARVARVKVDAIRMAAPLTAAAAPIPVTTAPPTPKGTFTMNLDFSSLFRNLLHIGGGSSMVMWLLGMFGVTPTMVSGAVGAVGTLVTIGSTIWSQFHAQSKSATPAPKS